MKFNQLQQICDLQYQSSQRKLASILDRENALRSELLKLQGFIEETKALPPEQAQMRAVGADIIWMRWVTTSQTQLNIELAQVLAQKEGLIAEHKRAFGKAQAAKSLATAEKEKNARHKREHALEQAISQSVFK